MWKPEYLEKVRGEAEEAGMMPSDLLQERAEALAEKLNRLAAEEKAKNN